MRRLPHEQGQSDRKRLVTQLVEEAGLREIAAAACAQAGVPGRAEQAAYCLIALVRKPDPPRESRDGTVRRTYCLDPGSDGFPERLAWWAERVARNLRQWASVYQAIQDEAERYEIGTLRRLIRTPHGDDVVDTLADTVADVLARGPRLEDMSIEHARRLEPPASAYAFHRPLSQWVATLVRRRQPWRAEPFDEGDQRHERRALDEEVDEAIDLADTVERAFLKAIAGLAETRALLEAEIERADLIEGGLARRVPASREEAAALARVRAEIVHVVDELSREQRALPSMIAYVVLALPRASGIQRTAVLSLRESRNDRDVIDRIAAMMRESMEDDLQPTPTLVESTRQATRRGVPNSRVRALDALRGAPLRRSAILAPVAQMLAELPPTVAGDPAIAAAANTSTGNVKTNRHGTTRELETVDRWLGRVFRRYARGRE